MLSEFKPITFTPIVMPKLVKDKAGIYEIPEFNPRSPRKFIYGNFAKELEKNGIWKV